MRPSAKILLPLLAAALLAACSNPGPSPSAKPVALTTIFAYYDAARALAKGTQIDIVFPLEPKTSPHDYAAVMRDKTRAAAATLYIKNGLALDDKFDDLVDRSRVKTITIASAIGKAALLQTEELELDAPATQGAKPADAHAGHDHAHHDHSLGNPHIWLDPRIQIKATQIIRDAFISASPADKATIEANANAYIADLEALDKEFLAAAKTFKTKEFIGFHSAYDYLAHRYGLTQIASVEEMPGDTLSIAQADKLIRLINDKKIKYIFIESAFDPRSLNLIKEKTGANEIVLQPLETYDNLNDTYTSLMRKNLEALKTALNP